MREVSLGIFLREPVPGKVKKRLAREVGADRACDIYKSCIRATLRIAARSGMPLCVFCTPARSIPRVKKMFHIRAPLFPQRGRTLGARMKNAFHVLIGSAPAAILTGTDSPTLPLKFLKQARKTLRINDLVLGPAEDGGYYLIGLTKGGFLKSGKTLFSRIAWGGPDVFKSTLERARAAGLRTGILPVWYDIDTAQNAGRAGFLHLKQDKSQFNVSPG